jgi:mxaA protein
MRVPEATLMPMFMRLSLLTLAVFAPLAWAAAPVTRLETVEPRAFGYSLGDVIERRVVVEAQAPYTLTAKSLPRPGRIGAWLELRAPEVKAMHDGGANRYQIVLVYQLVNSPNEVRTLALPEADLEFTGGERPVRETIPEFLFTAGPLTPEQIVARGPLDEMQPDVTPPPVPTDAIQKRLAGYAAAAAVILLFLAYALWGIPFLDRTRGPFARAVGEVKRLARARDDAATRKAIRRIHRAFDETAGRAVFASEVSSFLARHPRYASLGPEIARFYELSRQEFFAGGTQERGVLPWLAEFCRECRNRERGSR